MRGGCNVKFSLEKDYFGVISLPESFLSDKMNELDFSEIKVYLKVCLLCRQNQDAELSFLADAAQVNEGELLYIISSLEKKGLVKVSKSGIILVGENNKAKKSIDAEDFSDEENNDIKIIASATESAFGKLLSHADLNSIMGIYKFIELPAEVFVLAIDYCASLGKKSFNYIEKVLISWKEAGVVSAQTAHEYLRIKEENEQYYGKLKQKLGIYGFNLTKKQKEFADKWKNDFTIEQIVEACEKTIDGTGKISFAHTDKVLYNTDYEYQGASKEVKPTKFNNFKESKNDYSEAEQKALEKLLNRKKGD